MHSTCRLVCPWSPLALRKPPLYWPLRNLPFLVWRTTAPWNWLWMGPSVICSCLPASLDSLQFTYYTNRSVGDAITLALHMSLSDLEWKNTLCENIVGQPQVSIQYQNAQQACHPSYMTWGWTDICATGSWTFWQVGHKWSELAASHSAQELLKAACSGPFLYSLLTRGVTVHVFVPGPFQYRTFGMVQVCTKCNL